ncbi:hypothetical protein Bca4012_063281 [Brassica carinata]
MGLMIMRNQEVEQESRPSRRREREKVEISLNAMNGEQTDTTFQVKPDISTGKRMELSGYGKYSQLNQE